MDGIEHIYSLGVWGACLSEMTQLQEDRGFVLGEKKSTPYMQWQKQNFPDWTFILQLSHGLSASRKDEHILP